MNFTVGLGDVRMGLSLANVKKVRPESLKYLVLIEHVLIAVSEIAGILSLYTFTWSDFKIIFNISYGFIYFIDFNTFRFYNIARIIIVI